jgi:hypothetical protein
MTSETSGRASRTTTRVTHYHVQKKRRAEFIEEWRGYQ